MTEEGMLLHLNLNSGGQISLSINNVQLSTMSQDDRVFMLRLVDLMTCYVSYDIPKNLDQQLRFDEDGQYMGIVPIRKPDVPDHPTAAVVDYDARN